MSHQTNSGRKRPCQDDFEPRRKRQRTGNPSTYTGNNGGGRGGRGKGYGKGYGRGGKRGRGHRRGRGRRGGRGGRGQGAGRGRNDFNDEERDTALKICRKLQRYQNYMGVNPKRRKKLREEHGGIRRFTLDAFDSCNKIALSGTLKERYEDFLVNEIDLDDKVVHLESVDVMKDDLQRLSCINKPLKRDWNSWIKKLQKLYLKHIILLTIQKKYHPIEYDIFKFEYKDTSESDICYYFLKYYFTINPNLDASSVERNNNNNNSNNNSNSVIVNITDEKKSQDKNGDKQSMIVNENESNVYHIKIGSSEERVEINENKKNSNDNRNEGYLVRFGEARSLDDLNSMINKLKEKYPNWKKEIESMKRQEKRKKQEIKFDENGNVIEATWHGNIVSNIATIARDAKEFSIGLLSSLMSYQSGLGNLLSSAWGGNNNEKNEKSNNQENTNSNDNDNNEPNESIDSMATDELCDKAKQVALCDISKSSGGNSNSNSSNSNDNSNENKEDIDVSEAFVGGLRCDLHPNSKITMEFLVSKTQNDSEAQYIYSKYHNIRCDELPIVDKTGKHIENYHKLPLGTSLSLLRDPITTIAIGRLATYPKGNNSNKLTKKQKTAKAQEQRRRQQQRRNKSNTPNTKNQMFLFPFLKSKESRSRLHILLNELPYIKHVTVTKNVLENNSDMQRLLGWNDLNKILVWYDKNSTIMNEWPRELGNYIQFTLLKRGIDTSFALSLLTKELHSKSNKLFSFAGMKDRHAVTCQKITGFRVKSTRLNKAAAKLQNIYVGDFEYVHEPLKLGTLSGNRFTVAIRNIDIADRVLPLKYIRYDNETNDNDTNNNSDSKNKNKNKNKNENENKDENENDNDKNNDNGSEDNGWEAGDEKFDNNDAMMMSSDVIDDLYNDNGNENKNNNEDSTIKKEAKENKDNSNKNDNVMTAERLAAFTKMSQSEKMDFLIKELENRVESLAKRGFVNYFGMQRFGSSVIRTDEIGSYLLRKNFKLAIAQLLLPRPFENEHVKEKRLQFLKCGDPNALPKMLANEKKLISSLLRENQNTNYMGAFYSLPRNMRTMYVHAFQSKIWNEMASHRIKYYGYKVVHGDIVGKLKSGGYYGRKESKENKEDESGESDDDVNEDSDSSEDDIFISDSDLDVGVCKDNNEMDEHGVPKKFYQIGKKIEKKQLELFKKRKSDTLAKMGNKEENSNDNKRKSNSNSKSKKKKKNKERRKPSEIWDYEYIGDDNIDKYTIFDVLIPLPSRDVQFPDHETTNFCKRLLSKHRINLDMFSRLDKTWGVGGSYRYLLQKPIDMKGHAVLYEQDPPFLVDNEMNVMERNMRENKSNEENNNKKTKEKEKEKEKESGQSNDKEKHENKEKDQNEQRGSASSKTKAKHGKMEIEEEDEEEDDDDKSEQEDSDIDINVDNSGGNLSKINRDDNVNNGDNVLGKEIDASQLSKVSNKKLAYVLEFSLPKSCYATMCVRELMRTSSLNLKWDASSKGSHH